MRSLTKSEGRLVKLFLVLLFVIANLVGLPALWQHQIALETEIQRLRGEKLVADSLLANREVWLARDRWLDLHQPKFSSAEEASASLIESLQKTARVHQITILEQSFLANKEAANHYEAAVKIRVSGSLEMIVRWLHEIQRPELFQVIPAFSLKSAQEPPMVICDLQMVRWYAPNPSQTPNQM